MYKICIKYVSIYAEKTECRHFSHSQVSDLLSHRPVTSVQQLIRMKNKGSLINR